MMLFSGGPLRTQVRVRLSRADQIEHDRVVANARAQLDEATWETAWAEGRAMTLEQAIAYALEDIS